MRKVLLLSLFIGAVLAQPVEGRELQPQEAYRLVNDLFSDESRVRTRARRKLIESMDETIAPALVEVVFFSRNGRDDANDILEKILKTRVDRNEKTHGYKGWFSVIGSREDLTPKTGYLEFKAAQYSRIDPEFGRFLDPRHPRTIRPEEIIFGGVPKDGIPALRNPRMISAEAATYLEASDVVFGVSINGDHRAYPRRILASHEMANDVIGGEAVSLSYCTLCGSAIVYRGTLESDETYTFGTSGLLYRSNKLMYDHQTNTLWSQILGEPVVGPLVGKGKKLEVLPITITTWGEWKAMHPETKALSLDTGFRRDYSGQVYADYFASAELMFPVWKLSDELEAKEWVWTLEINGVKKAYPLVALFQEPLIHDVVGEVGIVLIADRASGSVRVFESGGYEFSLEGSSSTLVSEGVGFRISEDALVSEDGSVALGRIPGHQAYWFGWYAFHPDTELFVFDNP